MWNKYFNHKLLNIRQDRGIEEPTYYRAEPLMKILTLDEVKKAIHNLKAPENDWRQRERKRARE